MYASLPSTSAVIGDGTIVGATALTRMPAPAHSNDRTLVRWMIAALVTPYMADPAMATSPPVDARLTIAPPSRASAGCAAWHIRKVPLRLTSTTSCHASSGISSVFPRALMPALLTRRSSLPKRSTVDLTATRQESPERRSSSTACAAPGTGATVRSAATTV
jgi:hypothetical protein